jgi:hypothetical protein
METRINFQRAGIEIDPAFIKRHTLVKGSAGGSAE